MTSRTKPRTKSEPDPLALFPDRTEGDGETRLSTHCLLPNGDHAWVAVRRDATRRISTVSDGGCWWEAIHAAGLDPDTPSAVKAAEASAADSGFHFKHGEFYLRDVPDEELPGTVIVLANTVQSLVARAVARMRPREASMDAKLIRTLELQFGPKAVAHHIEVTGDSSRTYQVTAAVQIAKGRRALFRTVTPYPASLFACTAAFNDIGRAGPRDPRVAVIDHQEEWASADLSLLAQTASHILDLSKPAGPTLTRIAH